MNTLEQKALAWLINTTGYNAGDILYSPNMSPDFILPDGRGLEVKRLQARHGFVLYPRQWLELLKYKNCTITIWESSAEEPTFQTSVPPYGSKHWNGLYILCHETNPVALPLDTFLAACPYFKQPDHFRYRPVGARREI